MDTVTEKAPWEADEGNSPAPWEASQTSSQASTVSEHAPWEEATPAPANSSPQPYLYQKFEQDPNNDKVDPALLVHDKDWIDSTKLLYRSYEGKEFSGTSEQLSDYGLELMGGFNYHLPTMAIDASIVSKSPDDQKKAFLYLMDTYDKLKLSAGGVSRFVRNIATDPTTYVGLSTFGIGTGAENRYSYRYESRDQVSTPWRCYCRRRRCFLQFI